MQLLNVVRVISLFYIGQWDFAVFEWAHQYVWQALIMLDVLVVWLIWVRRVPRGATMRRRRPRLRRSPPADAGPRASRERPSARSLRLRHARVAAGRVRGVVRARAGHPVAGASCSCAASSRGGFGDLVRSVEAHGGDAVVRDDVAARRSADAGGVLTVDVNMLLYAFGLPLFVALTLAARQRPRVAAAR